MPTKKTTTRTKNQFGLLTGMDKDIESAKHDDIMLWTDKNLEQILKKLYPLLFSDSWGTYNNHVLTQFTGATEYFYTLRPIQFDPGIQKPPYGIEEKQWERPVRSKKGDTVGFIDLYVKAMVYSLDYRYSLGQEFYEPKFSFFFGAFEIKTTIALGPLIRQINFYKEYNTAANYIVVSPDTRYVDVLREQGIAFVEYLSI